MAVEYEGGVIVGADSRTSTGYVLPREHNDYCSFVLKGHMLLTGSLTNSHQ